MKADLEAAVSVTLVNLVVALDPNLAFLISTAGMDDSPGARLTSPTMTHIRSRWLPRGNYPKRAATALRRSLPSRVSFLIGFTLAESPEPVE
jgi:hypothetical protein